MWHIVNSGVGGGQRCEGGQVFSRGHHERGVQRQQANTLAFEASLIKYEWIVVCNGRTLPNGKIDFHFVQWWITHPLSIPFIFDFGSILFIYFFCYDKCIWILSFSNSQIRCVFESELNYVIRKDIWQWIQFQLMECMYVKLGVVVVTHAHAQHRAAYRMDMYIETERTRMSAGFFERFIDGAGECRHNEHSRLICRTKRHSDFGS